MKSRTSILVHQLPGLKSLQERSLFVFFDSAAVPSITPLLETHILTALSRRASGIRGPSPRTVRVQSAASRQEDDTPALARRSNDKLSSHPSDNATCRFDLAQEAANYAMS